MVLLCLELILRLNLRIAAINQQSIADNIEDVLTILVAELLLAL